MTTRRTILLSSLACLVLGALAPACGRTVVFPKPVRCVFDADCAEGLRCVDQVCRELEFPDGGPGGKRFGEPCAAGGECASSFCLGGPAGAFCTRACDGADAGCPSSYACKGLVDPNQPDGGPRVTLCAVPQPMLCQACASDLECGASGADQCVDLDGGHFCGRDCTVERCPPLYACRADARGAGQCVPEGRSCDCGPATLGLSKGCRGEVTAIGACPGAQRCQADGGFTACSAPPALAETCNGVDDDCNGRIDDFTPPTCTKQVGSVTCTGPQVCFASAGLQCAARPPEPEVCNGEDDDCNGLADEPFVDAQGRYLTVKHCGRCGHDCAAIIAHAVASAVSCDGTSTPARCRVTQCEPGYFPFDDGRLCLELPDTLCRACVSDSDCVGPGSRCLTVDGVRVCGRDCGPSSAYPTGCPGGYVCAPVDGGAPQCTPSTGTCSCKAVTLGATRSCAIEACRGFETCTSTAGGPSWGACDVTSYNPEICNGRDDNCDGQVDEGFKNQASGRYEAAQHCGFCNNDCTKYFSPTLQHTSGVCDLVPTTPRCAMGPCLTEQVGPLTYEWVDVNHDNADGCECRRAQGNVATDLPDRAPSPTGGASWIDENCDGIDGVQTDAIFVSAAAPAGGNGTRTAPLQTVSAGLTAMQASGKRYVLVAQGLYRENLRLFDGAQLFGGYSLDFLKRDPTLYPTQLQGVQPTAAAIAAVHAEALGTGALETVVAGFTIVGWDVASVPAAGAPGEASIAVYLRDVGPGFVLQSCDVEAGRGASGGRGSTGTQGYGRQSSTLLAGARGLDSQFFASGACATANHRAGGAGGANSECGAALGAGGGDVVCPVYSFLGNVGQQQMYLAPPASSKNGRGGFDWSYDTFSGTGCGHVTESGFPTSIQPHDGEDGKPGPDGAGGTGGAGAPAGARYGSVLLGRWVAAPSGAGAGLAGQLAEGGGGGGAGGGVARFVVGGCQGWEIGATGGGGGAGGCGGTGGWSGGGGGGSFGLFIVSTASGGPRPRLLGNRIQRGLGGNGGAGGFGGAGGLGGAGGFGGLAFQWSSSVGGKGGEGGNGGPGGGGGGGSGGPSFGVLAFNVELADLLASNLFLTPLAVDTGGAGGEGGSSPGPRSSSGTAGARGASANALTLWPCALGCAGGTSCDANGVCVPN
jgi:hypothetical protein